MTEYDEYGDEYDAEYDAYVADADADADAGTEFDLTGWDHARDSGGNPLTDKDGDFYLRNADGDYIVWSATTGDVWDSDVDFNEAAANAITNLLEDHPGAAEHLAEADAIVNELLTGTPGGLPPAPVNLEPSPDQNYTPKVPRDDSLSESLDQGIDDILGGGT